MTKLRVMIADDEELIRVGMRAIIDNEPDMALIAEADNGVDAVEQAKRTCPDVILMDVRMPVVDGIEATERIMRFTEPPKILVVTTFDNDDYVYDALRVGACGFVLKRTRPDDLLAAIRVAARGESLLFPQAVRKLARTRTVNGAKKKLMLTSREADVLRLMTKGLSNTEIGHELFVTPETVKTHVGNILRKLDARDRTQAVIVAYETGFVAAGDT